jgi:PST family polysaccharide transporter
MAEAPRVAEPPLTAELPKSGLFRTVGQLYAVQMASFALPLITVPYLARHLGAAGLGIVATFQALATWFTTLNEYGFSVSATREAARCKHDEQKLSQLLASVIGAKFLLAAGCGVLMLMLSFPLPSLRNQHLLLASALLYTFGQSASAVWLYQALDRIAFATTCDLAGRCLGVAAIFVCVKNPRDAWLALAIPGTVILLSAAFSISVAYRELPFRLPSFRSAFSVIRSGYAIFLSRCVGSMMNGGNALILSMFVSPAAVGYYSGAERIFRAGLTGLYPFSQVMFPRIAYLLSRDPGRARSEVLKSLSVMFCAASCVSAIMAVFGGFLVRVLLGPAFAPSVAVLRILALVPVARAVSDVLGLQWMISHGLDREYTICLSVAGAASLGAALFLSRNWGPVGAAWAVVSSEVLLAAGVLYCIGLRRIVPFPGAGAALNFSRAIAGESS